MNPSVAASGPRAVVQQMFVDRVDITRGTFPDVVTVATDVPAFIRTSGTVTREVSSGGENVVISGYQVRLPSDTDCQRGDVLTVRKSTDAEQVGRFLTVIEPVLGTEQTSRIVSCHESTA